MSAGRIFGAMYFVLGLLFVPLFAIPMMFSKQPGAAGFGVFAIAAPFIYGGMGFVGSAVLAWFYNVFAARIGGLELVLEEGDRTPGQPPA
jgi:hypothetical protein